MEIPTRRYTAARCSTISTWRNPSGWSTLAPRSRSAEWSSSRGRVKLMVKHRREYKHRDSIIQFQVCKLVLILFNYGKNIWKNLRKIIVNCRQHSLGVATNQYVFVTVGYIDGGGSLVTRALLRRPSTPSYAWHIV